MRMISQRIEACYILSNTTDLIQEKGTSKEQYYLNLSKDPELSNLLFREVFRCENSFSYH